MMFLIFYYKKGAEMLLSFDVKFKQNKCWKWGAVFGACAIGGSGKNGVGMLGAYSGLLQVKSA